MFIAPERFNIGRSRTPANVRYELLPSQPVLGDRTGQTARSVCYGCIWCRGRRSLPTAGGRRPPSDVPRLPRVIWVRSDGGHVVSKGGDVRGRRRAANLPRNQTRLVELESWQSRTRSRGRPAGRPLRT